MEASVLLAFDTDSGPVINKSDLVAMKQDRLARYVAHLSVFIEKIVTASRTQQHPKSLEADVANRGDTLATTLRAGRFADVHLELFDHSQV